jgi:hypothetical protein
MRNVSAAGTALALGIAALSLAALGSSATAKPAPLPKKTVPGRIEALAMDGYRVAYDVAASSGPKVRCNTVYVWNVRRRAATRVSSRATCGADRTSTGAGVRELALAGGRAAWIVNEGGNSESGDYLYTSPVSRPSEKVLASAYRTGDVSGVLTGTWIGGLVGSGSFLAVDRWVTDSSGTIGSQRLQRIGARLSDLAQGADTRLARSTDGRLLAVLRDDASVGVYSTSGRLLHVVRPTGGTGEVALRGAYLAALTTADTLEVFNSHSGRRLHSWHVAHGARSLDVSSGMAAYAAPRPGGGPARVVHLLRLSNGKDHVVATTPPQLTGVQLEPAGLVYAVNRMAPGEPGYLVFVPMPRLPRR